MSPRKQTARAQGGFSDALPARTDARGARRPAETPGEQANRTLLSSVIGMIRSIIIKAERGCGAALSLGPERAVRSRPG